MMDKYDLLEAMGGIRDEYVEEASRPLTDEKSGQKIPHSRSGSEAFAARRRRRRVRASFWAAAAAAVLCISVILPNLSPAASSAFQNIPFFGSYFRLVTIRSYQFQSDSADAYAEESSLVTMSKNSAEKDQDTDTLGVMSAGSIEPEEAAEYDGAAEFDEAAEFDGAPEYNEAGGFDEAAEYDETGEFDAAAEPAEAAAGSEETSVLHGAAVPEPAAKPDEAVEAGEEAAEAAAEPEGTAADTSVRAVLSAAQITQEIRQMEEQAVTGFEQNVSQETGYHTLRFLHRTVTDTEDWYSMEVLCYTASADGFEQVNHFTVNKKTGERVELEDLFREGADYITPVSEEIISQMHAQMREDPGIEYWIDSEEDPEYDFSRIREDQDFYIDDQGRLVICFNEMEAAPMYMGTVEFTIPDSVLSSIRIQ